MSQDTHLFSVRRPRETLGGINYNTAFSGIPQPSSALKRSSSSSGLKDSNFQAPHTINHARSQSSSRMSLAPGRPPQPSFQRSSSGNNLTEMGRSGLQRSSSSNAFNPRMSFAPGAMTPRAQPPMSGSQSIQRRSSVYSRPSTSGPMMSQQSFFMQGPIGAVPTIDTKRIRDRAKQQQFASELEDYLNQNNFQMEAKHVLRPDTLRNPTQKDFTMIFQWLYNRIDPAYQFQKPMDYEVPPILKQLRCPYEKLITKSALMAVGGQNWSIFLGMLHWIMQLAVMMERYKADQYDYACAEEGVDVSSDRIMFRFLNDAYQTWLSSPPSEDDGEDDSDKLLEPHVQAMAQEFESGNEQFVEQLKVLEAENEALRRQIEEAEKEVPDIDKLQEHILALDSDKKKLGDWEMKVVNKIKQYESKNQLIKNETEDWKKQLEEAVKEKNDLQQAVDSQGITVTDIDRMNGERERLQNGVEAAKTRLEELGQKIKDKEAEASGKLASLEGLVRDFNSLCYDVGVREEEFELVLQINEVPFSSSQLGNSQRGGAGGDRLLLDSETGYHPTRIMNLDLRGKVKTHLNTVRKQISKRRNDAKDKDEENKRMLFEVSNAIDDKQLEVEALEHRVRSAEEEFEKTKDNATTQKLNSDAQIEKAEKELAKMRAGLTESVQLMEQRELNTQFQYEQLTSRANSLREELHTEIDRILHDICKFKMHVQDSLEGYEGLVVEELDQELGTEDVGEQPNQQEGEMADGFGKVE